MAGRMKIAFFAAVFFGLLAAYGIYNFLEQQKRVAHRMNVRTQALVVAKTDIPPGIKIDKQMLKMASWTVSSIPPGTFKEPSQVLGQYAKLKVLAGDPITAAKLSQKDGSGLTVRLAPGHRAMAVKVNEIVGVSGFIAPNDRVDVITTIEPPGGKDPISKIVLQNKRVLSVAQRIEDDGSGKPKVARSITLEVKPNEAEKLSLATIEGKIILALRGTGDEKQVYTAGSRRGDLLSITAPPKPRARPSIRKHSVEVYMGSARSVHQF